MKRWGIIILGVLLVGGLAWSFSPPHEPSYEGKSLSYWLHVFEATDQPEPRQKAEIAIQKIGTNALPILLQMLQEKDSPATKAELAIRQWLKSHFHWHISSHPAKYQPADERNMTALTGFVILGGSVTKDAVPDLVRIYNESNLSGASRCYIISALGYIGPSAKDAVPAIMAWLSASPVASDKTEAMIYALGSIHSLPDLAVPILIKHLGAVSSECASGDCIAINALEKFGAEAKPAVPELLKMLHHESWLYSQSAARALIKIDPDQTPTVVQVLLKRLTNNCDSKQDVISMLGEIHSKPELVVPILIDHLSDPQVLVRAFSASALGKFGAKAKPAVPALLNSLKIPKGDKLYDPEAWFSIHPALLEIDPETAARAGIK